MNLKYMKVSLFEITFSRHSNLLRCTCSSDVQNKIVEHHKIESGCKKISKVLKIPIPHQGLMHGEEESLSG